MAAVLLPPETLSMLLSRAGCCIPALSEDTVMPSRLLALGFYSLQPGLSLSWPV